MVTKYSKEIKASVVYEICELKTSTSKVASSHHIPIKTVENWVTAYNKDHSVYDIGQLADSERIKLLEKENAQLRRDNEILKKTIRLVAGKE